MSLFDFFFPEQAQAMHLRTLAEQSAYRPRHESRVRMDDSSIAIKGHAKRLDLAEDDLGTLALVCESLIRLGERKGLFTRDELLKVMAEVDVEDGRKDGKFKANSMTAPPH